VFLFPHILASICCCCVIDDSHSDRVRWKMNVVLICIFFMTKDVSISSRIYCSLVLLFLRIVCSFAH
jgi:hypothetical protein